MMVRRVLFALSLGLLGIVAVDVAAGCGADTNTGEAFVDNWREPGAHPAYVMRIELCARRCLRRHLPALLPVPR